MPFPLSLVISRKTIVRYQFIFRLLLHLRLVHHSLCFMWVDQKGRAWKAPYTMGGSKPTKAASSRPPSRATGAPDDATPEVPAVVPEVERWRRRTLNLRARMLAFVQHVLTFVTHEVLEPNWRKLEAKLSALADSTASDKAQAREGSVEDLLRDHVDFLDTCLKESMLTSSKLLTVSVGVPRMLIQYLTFFSLSPNLSQHALHMRSIRVLSQSLQRWLCEK